MERLKKNSESRINHNFMTAKNILLALGLAFGIPNFSYSQESGGRHVNETEQQTRKGDRNIETYKIRVEIRNNNIKTSTNETIDGLSDRLGKQFDLEARKNGIIFYKVNEIKNILNINNDNPLLILQRALISIANTNNYKGLELYTSKFSGNFDINFVNAVGYIQFMNQLSDNGSLLGKNGEATLDMIIRDLQGNRTETVLSNNATTMPAQNNIISQMEPVHEPIRIQPEINQSHIGDRINKINSDYSTKVSTRNIGIMNGSNETLDTFVGRMKKNFKNETDNHNSLVSKKISNIQILLHNKYNLQISDNPVLIIQSALTELSKTEKYRGLLEYTEKFSGNFDLNFIDAYGLVQYINDWNCNWVLYGNDGALILQSLYDDLNNNEKIDLKHENNGNLNRGTENGNINGNGESNINNNGESNINNNGENNLNRDGEKDNNEVPNIEENNIKLEGIALLSRNLSLNNLNGITYEDVWNTIDGFRHEGLRNAVMDRLLHNDIIGAQKLLGMDPNCDSRLYPDYVAGKKLGQRELKLMEKHSEYRRYMDSQEFLNNMEKVERAYEIENYEVKTAYLKFLSGEFDNGGLPYCIISKYDYKIYLFSADHKFLASYPVVVGAHVGNHPNDVGEHLKDPENAHHTTPGGMYRFGGFFERSLTGKDLTIGFGTHFGTFEPLEGQYNFSSECALGIHGFVIGRELFFYSQEMKDRTKSNGCINFLRKLFGDIFNHLKNGSMIYICKDDEISNDGGIGYIDNENIIEMIEHFGYNPQKTIHLNDAENYGYCDGNSGDTKILGRRILSQNSVVGSELPYRYNLNFVTSSKNTDIFNIFKQREKTPYNKMHKKKYIS